MKFFAKKEIIPVAIILIMFLFAFSFYFSPCLPDKLPSHWNVKGEIDAYSAKNFALFFPPAICLAVYLLMLFLPLIDPLRKNYKKFAIPYYFIRLALVIFFVCLYFYTLLAGLGLKMNIVYFIVPLMALFFVVIGFSLPKIEKNYFVGIRTPWTLENDEVWKKTHKLSGETFVIAGVLGLLTVFFGKHAFWIFIILILVAVFIPVVYSYFLYKKVGIIKGKK